MRVLPISDQAITEAIAILLKGGVVAHPTETCYGLACDLTNPNAVAKLFRIKLRPPDQPVSALFPSVDTAKEYVEWNDRAEELAREYLPGPLTMILPVSANVPFAFQITAENSKSEIRNPKRSVGIRVSSNAVARELAVRFGKPISTTSANIHGKPTPYSTADITAQFADETDQPDLILDGGNLPSTPPSTVVDLTGGGTVRQGGVRL